MRRAAAVGELARRQQTLDLNLTPTHDGTDADAEARGGGRGRWCCTRTSPTSAITDPRLGELGRLENTRSLITAEQVRAWCANPDTMVVVRPVIDLNDHVHVTQYEVPDRMAEAAVLADVTCVFPFCTRPARGCRAGEHDADCDHITPHGRTARRARPMWRRCAGATTG